MPILKRLQSIITHLRSPEGCPWDREQTHASLTPYLAEECAEVIDAIDRNDMEHLREELGDLLLQIMLHTEIASEGGYFGFDDVANELADKLVRRHPWVFGDTKVENMDELRQNWERIKKEEKAQKKSGKVSKAGGSKAEAPHIPLQLSSLLYAKSVIKAVRRAKSESTEKDILIKDDHASADEMGKKMYDLVELCVKEGIDPETALRHYAQKQIQHHFV